MKSNSSEKMDLFSSSTPIRQSRQKDIGFDQTVYSPPKTARPNLNSLAKGQTQQQGSQDDLASKVVDQSAPLSTILFQEKYAPSLWGINDDENELMMQVAIPWKLARTVNIFRVTVPFLTNTPAPGDNGANVPFISVGNRVGKVPPCITTFDRESSRACCEKSRGFITAASKIDVNQKAQLLLVR